MWQAGDAPAAGTSAIAATAGRYVLLTHHDLALVKEIPRQGRLEGCHIMSAAMHLICGLEGV